jgi:hypothetical protein
MLSGVPEVVQNVSFASSGLAFQDEDATVPPKIFLRISLDFPITFYALQSDGLVAGGVAIYDGDPAHPDPLMPLHHEVVALPGATFGAEFQLLKFLSFEFLLMISFGDTKDNTFLNRALGMDVKLPIRYGNFVFQPYGSFYLPINSSSVFAEFPAYALGGGIQICSKGRDKSDFFVDIKYLSSVSDAIMHNRYGELYPKPPVIHYRHSALGIGLGYRYEIFGRKNNAAGF